MCFAPGLHFTNVFLWFWLLGLPRHHPKCHQTLILAKFFNVFCSWASLYRCFPMVLAPGLPLPPSQIEWICYQIFISPRFFNGFCSRASFRPSFFVGSPPERPKYNEFVTRLSFHWGFSVFLGLILGCCPMVSAPKRKSTCHQTFISTKCFQWFLIMGFILPMFSYGFGS